MCTDHELRRNVAVGHRHRQRALAIGHSLRHRNKREWLLGFKYLVLGRLAYFNELRSRRLQRFFGCTQLVALFRRDRHNYTLIRLEHGEYEWVSDFKREHDLLGGLYHGRQHDSARDSERKLSRIVFSQHLVEQRIVGSFSGQPVSSEHPG